MSLDSYTMPNMHAVVIGKIARRRHLTLAVIYRGGCPYVSNLSEHGDIDIKDAFYITLDEGFSALGEDPAQDPFLSDGVESPCFQSYIKQPRHIF